MSFEQEYSQSMIEIFLLNGENYIRSQTKLKQRMFIQIKEEEINMAQLNRSIISKLNQMYETLDEIQEIWIVNENKNL